MSQSDEKQEPSCRGNTIGAPAPKKPEQQDQHPDDSERESIDLGPNEMDELQPDQSVLTDLREQEDGLAHPQPELKPREEFLPPQAEADSVSNPEDDQTSAQEKEKEQKPPATPGNAAPWHRRYWQLPIVLLLLLAIVGILGYGIYRLAPPAYRWISDLIAPDQPVEEPIRLRCEKYELTYNGDGTITTGPCQCLTGNCPPQVWIKNSRVELVRENKPDKADPVVTQVIVRGDFYTSPPN